MNMIIAFAKRNLLIFFRDRLAVVFSFLSVFVIIALYALFLGDLQVKNLKSLAGNVQGIRFLVDSWIMAGILAVNTVTVTLGAFSIMVTDESKNIMQDFLVSPIKRASLVASYILSSLFIGFMISAVAFFLGEIYIVIAGGVMLPFGELMKVLGVIFLCVFSSSSMVFLVVSFVRSESAFSTLSTLIATLIGFMAGIYVPIGILPDVVQNIMKFIPITYGAVYLRMVFMRQPLEMVFENASGDVIANYRSNFGLDIHAFGGVVSENSIIMILIGSGLLFFGISIVKTLHKKTK